MATAIGITLPLQRGQTGYFAQSFDVRTQVKANFVNLMMTRKGERLFQPDFGCDIHKFLFENMTEDTETQIEQAIETAVTKWMPYLVLKNISVGIHPDENQIAVSVEYSIKNSLGITDSVVLVF